MTDDNVKVIVRVRPLLGHERNQEKVISVLEHQLIQLSKVTTSRRQDKYVFDYVGDVTVTQEEIFQQVGKPIADYCLKGYNGTIFAYGQTGSGKTFTMTGELDEEKTHLRGLMPRVFEHIFTHIERKKNSLGEGDFEASVKCSCCEIYQNQAFDLLNDGATAPLAVRDAPKTGPFLAGATEIDVQTVEEALDVLNLASENRRISSTAMNKQSSRSHLMFILMLKFKEVDVEKDIENVSCAKFNMVDLAGSERQSKTKVTGKHLKEANEINKSLTTLGMVIQGLVKRATNKHQFIHYRDSTLTYLLKESLGGNAKTFMVANVNPSINQLAETVSTLKFATRAKEVKNQALLNQNSHGTVESLQREIDRLRKAIAALKKGGASGDYNKEDSGAWRKELKKLAEDVVHQKHLMEDIRSQKQLLDQLVAEKDAKNRTLQRLYDLRNKALVDIHGKVAGNMLEEEARQFLCDEIDALQEQLKEKADDSRFDMDTLISTQLEKRYLESELKEMKTSLQSVQGPLQELNIYKSINEMALQRIAELEKGDDDERSDGPRRKRSISAGRVADVKDFEDQINELNMQIQEREKKVKRQEAEVITLTQEVVHYQGTIQEMRDLMTDLNRQNRIQAENHDRQLQALTEKHQSQLKETCEEVIQQMSQADQQNMEIEMQLKMKTNELEVEIGRRKEFQDRVDHLTKSLDENRERSEKHEKILQAKLDQANLDVKERQESLELAMKSLDAMKHDLKEKQQEFQLQEDRLHQQIEDAAEKFELDKKSLNMLLKAKEQTVADKENELERHIEQMECLELDLELKGKESQNLTQQLERLKAENSNLQQQKQKLTQNNERLKQELDNSNQELTQKLGDEFGIQLEKKREELDISESKLADVEALLAKSTANLDEANATIESEKEKSREHAQIAADLRKQIELQQKSLDKYEKEKRNAEDRFESTQKELDDLKEKKMQEIKALQMEKLEQDVFLKKLKDDKEKDSMDLRRCKIDLEELRSQFSEQENELKALRVSESNLQRISKALEKDLDAVKTKMTMVETERDAIQQESAAKLRKEEEIWAEKVRVSLEEKEVEMDKLQKDKAKLIIQMRELECSHKQQQESLQNQKSKALTTCEELEILQSERQKLEKDLSVVKSEYDENKKELKRKENMIKDMQDSKKRMKNQMSAMARENDNIASSVQKLRQLYQQLQRSKDEQISELEKQFTRYKEKFNDGTNESKRISKKYESLKKQNKELLTKVEDLRRGQDQHDDALRELEEVRLKYNTSQEELKELKENLQSSFTKAYSACERSEKNQKALHAAYQHKI